MGVLDASEDSTLLQATHGDERRKSDSSLLRKPNDQMINKVQKQLRDLADGKVDEGSTVTIVKSTELRTVRTQNGTVVKARDPEAMSGQSSSQKDTLITYSSALKENTKT